MEKKEDLRIKFRIRKLVPVLIIYWMDVPTGLIYT